MLIGLDVGTTACKALLFEIDGRIIASSSTPYELITQQQGWVEQDGETLWLAVVKSLRDLAAQIPPGRQILALAQSSQGGTTIPVDSAGIPTHNAISWMDTRAQAEYEAVRGGMGAEAIQRKTGWPLMAGLPLQHLRWLRHHRGDVFARTHWIMFVNDFIGWRLTGERCMNPSDASITQLCDIEAGNWDDELLALAGVRREQLSPLRESGADVGRLTADAAQRCGLPAGLPFINGAHDQYCAALGLGVVEPGEVLLSCGTAWVLLAVPPSLAVGRASGMALSCHAVPGRWGAIRSLGAVGTSLEWLASQVWARPDVSERRTALYAAINEAAARSEPGGRGLLFFPPAGGHAGGFGMAHGGFVGLTLAHTRDDLSRAVMEGVACELRWAVDELRATGMTVDGLKMVGGAARSPLWPQIVADITGVSVVVPGITEAAAWGAAALAGIGAGVFADVESAARAPAQSLTRYEPGNRAASDGLYERYRKTWTAVAS